jgi:hypothetical protein
LITDASLSRRVRARNSLGGTAAPTNLHGMVGTGR